MTGVRPVAAFASLCAACLVSGCGAQPVRAPEGPAPDMIVLLPDPDTGTTGRARVSNASGSVDLAAPRESTRVATNQAPAPVLVMRESDVQASFGDALAALPPAPQHFTLYCRFDSDKLTDESRRLVPQVLEAVRNRPTADVLIVGHTDTVGARAYNLGLGRERASSIRNLLTGAGLMPIVEIISSGERDLLVPTPDKTPEPRNRRVEITIR